MARQYIIESIEAAQDHATQWLWTYNNDRPNMGIGGITPAERVIRSLDRIIEWRGKPGTIRVDNGPEYISGKLLIWASSRGITIQIVALQP